MEEYKIEAEGGQKSISVEVIRSPRKTMAIQVHADGRVTFRIPKQLPGTDVQKQLESHRGWILNKLLEMEDRRKKREKAKGGRTFAPVPPVTRPSFAINF